MPIESKVPIGEINIKNLAIDSPKHREQPLYDVENAVSPEKWDEIIARQRAAKGDMHRLLTDGEAIRIISPNKFEQVKMSDTQFEEFYNVNVTRSGFQLGRIQTAAHLKSAYPQKDVIRGLEEGDKEKLAEWIKESDDGYHYAYLYKLLFPSEHPENFISEEARTKIQSKLTELLQSARKNKNWEYFVFNIMDLKFILPEIVEKIGLNQYDWRGMKEQVDTMPVAVQFTSQSYSRFLAGLKILSATTAEITTEGVRLTPPPEFSGANEVNSLPEVKKF